MKEQEKGCIKQHEDGLKLRVRCFEHYECIFEKVMTRFSPRQTLEAANSARGAEKGENKIRKALIKWCYINVFCRKTCHKDCTKKENDAGCHHQRKIKEKHLFSHESWKMFKI